MKKRTARVAALLIGTALLASLAFSGCSSSSEEEGSSAEEEASASIDEVEGVIVVGEVEDSADTGQSVQTITITATGDCSLGQLEEHTYDGSFAAYWDSYGADYFLEDVRSIFEADDFTLVNLECVLSTADDLVEKDYNIKGDPEYVSILSGSSVEGATLGNNHTYDYGEEGYQETKSVLSEAGITYACTEGGALYTTDEGLVIGYVSASLVSQSQEKVDTLISQIAELREEGADIIIAACHWGTEKEYYPTDFQETTAHALIDAGADLVIGNHPHVLQGVEVYEGKVICYSLGNFCYGGNKNPTDKETMIYQQTFTFVDGELVTDTIDATIIPCTISSTDSYNDYQPTVAEGEEALEIITNVNEYSAALGGVSFDEGGVLLYTETE